MSKSANYNGQLVFGLDIGTRSIVGTVGYRKDTQFIVVSQTIEEHTTRSMLDGQIHDIAQVSETIRKVKEKLEKHTKRTFKEVCIAAAGRVLQTITTRVDVELEYEKEINQEDIHNLESLGVEKAYEEFGRHNKSKDKFFCVGYSIVKYYLNDYPITNLNEHKGAQIGVELIATFLPNEVVDGLYHAVELAGLEVVNLTLEPIAAMHVAIPDKYRMLNIALVDVGAGTSDICITKGGSIVAYGMIPCAGDAITEAIAEHCLVDFSVAERIKREATEQEAMTYDDILLLPQTISREELHHVTEVKVDEMAKLVADKIKELNGGKPVSAVFVIGGGGKYEGYTEKLAKHLEIAPERVALRGIEVMQDIVFKQKKIEKNSMLVTPVGICLSFYEHNNNFIYALLNDEKIKLYDNGQLGVVDAIMQANIPNEDLFPKRGKPLHYILDGKAKIARGTLGEAAGITLNGLTADLHTPIKAGDQIKLVPSTVGEKATLTIEKVMNKQTFIKVEVNGQMVKLPIMTMVNNTMQYDFYQVQDKDEITQINYYTVAQLLENMDLNQAGVSEIYVNNEIATMETLIYDQFTVRIEEESVIIKEESAITEDIAIVEEPVKEKGRQIIVMVNQRAITLTGKETYVFVDIFEVYQFNLEEPQGKELVTRLNHRKAQYLETIQDGDIIEIYWKER